MAIVPGLNNGKINQHPNPSIGEPINALHYVQIKRFSTVQLLVAAYPKVCEINVAHKEIKSRRHWSFLMKPTETRMSYKTGVPVARP